jgi:MFS transporter, NNP family, nitrate/nitrite transporter
MADYEAANSESLNWPRKRAAIALTLTTVSFAICFASWVINAMLVTYLVQNGIFDFSSSQVGWLLATPILSGAISRLPLGILTDKYGGRIVLTILMLGCAIPMFLLSLANNFSHFLLCSLGFGLAGGGFAVGVGYVSSWYPSEKQGTALGIFGMGNAGAAITSLAAPGLLAYLATDANPADSWRHLPEIYAAVLVTMALVFFFGSEKRIVAGAGKSLGERLAPLASGVVWRFGLYYALVFGSFVAIAQWLVPYSVNVYQISLVEAGFLAAAFSLPSGGIRALGGWLSDRYGARKLMYSVFMGCAICCSLLAIPKMNITSPGVGITARVAGTVSVVSTDTVVIADRRYDLTEKPAVLTVDLDSRTNSLFLPRLQNWQEVVVSVGDEVDKDQLIASGVTDLYYPANFWIFSVLVVIFGILTGIGKAGVFKFIPDHYPDNVGTVGGIVGLIGALGGFVLPMLFSYLLEITGVWTTCWLVLAVFSIICLIWMQRIVNRILESEAPNLANLIESSATRSIPVMGEKKQQVPANVEALLQGLPFFHDLSHEELHAVAGIGVFGSAQPGDTIFKQGDPGDALYVLITGKVQIFLHGEDEQRIDLAELSSGAYFGDLALIDGQPRSAFAQAMEACDFFLVGRAQFLRLMTESPRILADVLIGLSEHIRNTNQRYVDINEKKERLQAQAELERHQSIAEMVAGVAHEINTPLGIVNHAASIITEDLNEDSIEELAKDDDAEKLLEGVMTAGKLIQDNIRRADKLITSFKNLSVRQITEELEEVRISEIIEDVLRLYAVKAGASNLNLVFESELALQDLWTGYPGPFGQVLMNLISNADRYAYPGNEGGKLEVLLKSTGTVSKYDYQVSVRDYGTGIEASEQKKVFDAFYTTGRSKGGAGIGLSIVHNLVTFQLDGAIELESSAGNGCQFTIFLPKNVKEKTTSPHLIQGDTATV